MNNFRRKQLRGFPVTILTALLLVVAIAFSTIGYAASDGTKQQLSAVESRYTTIGAMKDQNSSIMLHDGTYMYVGPDTIHGLGSEMRWRNKNYTILEDGSIEWDDGTVFHSANVLEGVAKDAPQIRTIARSAILSAHVDGIYGLTSGTQNRLQFNQAFDSFGYSLAVLVVTNLNNNTVEGRLDEGIICKPYSVTMIMDAEGYRELCLLGETFKIDKIVSMHPTYAMPFKRTSQIDSQKYKHMWILTDPEE